VHASAGQTGGGHPRGGHRLKAKSLDTCPGSSPRVSASREDAVALDQPPYRTRE
jgi:hypothetical protein